MRCTKCPAASVHAFGCLCKSLPLASQEGCFRSSAALFEASRCRMTLAKAIFAVVKCQRCKEHVGLWYHV